MGQITRSALWVYTGSMISGVLGYVFWIAASTFVSPNAVGSASAILAFQSLIISVSSLGIPTGVKRFVGWMQKGDNYSQGSSYFVTAVAMVFLLNLPVVFAISLLSMSSIQAFGLTSAELGFVSILMLLSFWPPVLISLFDSLLKTEVTSLAQIASTITKLMIGIVLLMMGFDFLGLMIALIAASLATDLVLLLSLVRTASHLHIRLGFDVQKAKDLIRGSIPAWIPNTLAIVGQSLGVLILYAYVGGTDTGLYYLAYAIASIVYTLPTSILGLMFPVLSGMEVGREQAASNAIRLSLALTAPVAFLLVLYPAVPFALLSSEYYNAYPILRLLVAGAIIYPIYAGYYSYVYAIGKYAHVLVLGVTINLSRLALYFILVAETGAIGVAISYTLSIAIGLAVVLVSSRSIGFRPGWRNLLKPIVVTGAVTLVLYILSIEWFIGIAILLFASMLLYTRLGVITKTDLREISEAFVSKDRLANASVRFRFMLRILFGE